MGWLVRNLVFALWRTIGGDRYMERHGERISDVFLWFCIAATVVTVGWVIFYWLSP